MKSKQAVRANDYKAGINDLCEATSQVSCLAKTCGPDVPVGYGELSKQGNIPPALAKLAVGRDNLTTREFAKAVNKAEQTVRKLHSTCGEVYGIKPTKIGNQLQWSVASTAKLLMEGE
jgi:hypothetical protein